MKKLLLINLFCFLLLFCNSCFAKTKPEGEGINKLKNKADSRKFDKMIEEFMEKHDIPGLSFAFAKNGKMLFAKGYGFVDKDKKEKANINHRFRMASISKPITSVAILTLIEQGKLSLNDKVFGKDGIFKGKYLKNPDLNLELIEVRHLLQHTAAPEWSNQEGIEDPMFVYWELSQDDLIKRILTERKIQNKPGTKHTYSNFGYCLLGRVIEEISGKTYEIFVKDMFSKHGINSFAITGDGLAAKSKDESYYFFENADNPNVPYIFPAARMDSHGGWISTAVDLVKFAQLVDGFSKPKDILSQKTIELMKTPTAISKNYGLGWAINESKNSWHGGSLPGTSSTLVNTHDGMTWCVLANKRGTDSNYYNELDSLTWEIIKDVEK